MIIRDIASLLAAGSMLVTGAASAADVAPGMPQRAVASAQAYSASRGGTALVIQHAGRIVFEQYSNGGAANRSAYLMSVTKNIVALGAFVAQAEGLLDLDEPVGKTIPEWRDKSRSRVTLRQLLDQTSGLSPGNSVIYGKGMKGKTGPALALKLVTEPGARFDYGAGNFEVFGEVLRRKLERRGTKPLAYFQSKIFSPIGIRPADWIRDRLGAPYYSTGVRMTARDLIRFGELVLARGRAGLRSVVPAGEFERAFQGTKANSMYGLTFWLNQNASKPGATELSIEGTLGNEYSPEQWSQYCISRKSPPDLVAMVGSGGVRCYVVPSRKLVIVRLGSGPRFADADFLARLFPTIEK